MDNNVQFIESDPLKGARRPKTTGVKVDSNGVPLDIIAKQKENQKISPDDITNDPAFMEMFGHVVFSFIFSPKILGKKAEMKIIGFVIHLIILLHHVHLNKIHNLLQNLLIWVRMILQMIQNLRKCLVNRRWLTMSQILLTLTRNDW